jgi:hypothetical protein
VEDGMSKSLEFLEFEGVLATVRINLMHPENGFFVMVAHFLEIDF